MRLRFDQHPRRRIAAHLSALWFVLVVVLVFVSPLNAASQGPQSSPIAVVERLHDNLLDVMKNATNLGLTERFDRLAPEITRAFAMAKTLQGAIGSAWTKAENGQRERLLAAFTDLSIGTYARRFNGFSGESFETIAERAGPRGTKLVETRIVRPDEKAVGLTYVTMKIDGTWQIVDVLLNNAISELAVRRSEYRHIIQQDGIDALIATLRRKADELIGR